MMSSSSRTYHHHRRRGSNNRPDHQQLMTPTIYRLAADRKWSQIPAAVQNRPADLQWMDSYGSTALHILCQARRQTRESVAAASSCVRTLPCAVQWQNSATWTPLHFAVFQTPADKYRVQLILLLLRCCPAALQVRATTGYKTKTAFHMACEVNADCAVLRAMLRIDPSLATAPYTTPRERARTAYYHCCAPSQQQPAFAETPLHIVHKHHAGDDTGRKMALLLEAAVNGRVGRRRRRVVAPPFQLLHAACRVEAPRAYVLQLIEEHTGSCLQADQSGLLPLHIVLRQSPSPHNRWVLQGLLEAAPEAAAVPCGGAEYGHRLPLHLAVGGDWRWEQGVRELVHCHAEALRVPDPASGLLPFQAAAADASTAYELLRAAPELLG